jgi:hypothetical protein
MPTLREIRLPAPPRKRLGIDAGYQLRRWTDGEQREGAQAQVVVSEPAVLSQQLVVLVGKLVQTYDPVAQSLKAGIQDNTCTVSTCLGSSLDVNSDLDRIASVILGVSFSVWIRTRSGTGLGGTAMRTPRAFPS